MSLISPSLHSVTTQLTVPVCTPISGFFASMYLTLAVSAVPTDRVFVMTMGDSSVPSSSICTRPTLLPKPLMTAAPANSFSRNVLPECGRMAVTPVFTLWSSLWRVT